MRQQSLHPHCALHQRLETLYARFNRPEHIDPDPLAVALEHPAPADLEVAGLVAASLAFGGVRQIMSSVRAALAPFPHPARDLAASTPARIHRNCSGFRHRYAGGEALAGLLLGIRAVLRGHGSLEAAFLDGMRPDDGDSTASLAHFMKLLRAGSGTEKNYLLPVPELGSACKRMHLYLRWMARRDAVDPGPWRGVPPSLLVMPVDLHIHRIALALGFTRRRQADLKTALEITGMFRWMAPEDPVRYDFCLTRAGMAGLDLGELRMPGD